MKKAKNIKKNEFKVEIDGNTITIWVWDKDGAAVGRASTDDLLIEDLPEELIEKLVLLAKKDLQASLIPPRIITPKTVSAESMAYKVANPRK
jgi:hypothetical protein